ncbi:MAG TPA: Gfo/Idh/MocA family oxidoreductase [Candidatus Altiarchaeales archaeon]|nr:Gfo/Idh/MocA family oxidoreductase [Candidatus Altiarchaeales archaeon]
METLNAAVIGVGSMGFNHARIYCELKNTELAAVSDPDQKRAEKIAQYFSCKPYSDYMDMLKSEKIDVASIAVPTQYHAKVALDAMESGVNVLVEKPISDSIQDGRKIINSAKKNGVKLMVGHIERFNPAVRKLKELLDEGALGKIFKMHSTRVGSFPRRIRDVGVVVDLAVHDIDIMRYLTGSEVKRVYAEAERRIHTSHEDLLSGLLKFGDESIGVLNVNWLTPEKIREISVLGEKGMFIAKYLTQELWFYENIEVKDEEYTYNDILMGVSEGDIQGIRIKKQEPLRNELEYFIQSVLEKTENHSSGIEGLRALEVAQAMIESTRENRVITL